MQQFEYLQALCLRNIWEWCLWSQLWWNL